MEKKKIHYGWYIVIGCLLITCTMVPPIMALSNKFLIQVTVELGLSRSGFTLANTILQGLGIFISPMVSSRLAKGDMRKIQCISIIGFAHTYATYTMQQNPIHETIKQICEAVNIPVIAIGGITHDNVMELAGSGICGIAVVSAIFAAEDITKATRELKELTLKMKDSTCISKDNASSRKGISC